MTPPVPPIERIRIERSGGFAGLRAGVQLDHAALTAAQRVALDSLLAAPPSGPSPGADRFRYRLTVVRRGAPDATLDVSEDAMPSALAALCKPS